MIRIVLGIVFVVVQTLLVTDVFQDGMEIIVSINVRIAVETVYVRSQMAYVQIESVKMDFMDKNVICHAIRPVYHV